jgi:hypothetical protein
MEKTDSIGAILAEDFQQKKKEYIEKSKSRLCGTFLGYIDIPTPNNIQLDQRIRVCSLVAVDDCIHTIL